MGTVYAVGPRWYANYVDPTSGERVRRSMGRSIRTEAQARAHLRTLEAVAGAPGGPVGFDTIGEVVESFLGDKAERREARTVRGYRLHLESFTAHVGVDTPINEVRREHVASFLRARVEGGLSKVTANKELVTLRVFWRWAERSDMADADPSRKVDAYSVRPTPRKPPPLEAFQAGLADLRRMTLPGARWTGKEARLVSAVEAHAADLYADALELISWTGIRIGEVAALLATEVDLKAGTFYVRASGPKGPRTIPLTPGARAVIERRLLDRGATVFVTAAGENALDSFANTGKHWRKRAPQFALVTPHGVRHLVNDRLRAAGVDPVIAARLLGHKTLQMHGHYSHESLAELREAVTRLGAPLVSPSPPTPSPAQATPPA